MSKARTREKRPYTIVRQWTTFNWQILSDDKAAAYPSKTGLGGAPAHPALKLVDRMFAFHACHPERGDERSYACHSERGLQSESKDPYTCPNPSVKLISAGRREGRRAGRTSLGAGWMEEIQHPANHPISHRDSKGESRNDCAQQHGREKERGHILFNSRCPGNHPGPVAGLLTSSIGGGPAALDSKPPLSRLF
jgi:hypothetical protein